MNYPKYIKHLDLDAHVHVFKQAIKVNDVTQEGTKIVYLQWMLPNIASISEDNFVNNHLDYTFNKFAQVFCRRYYKV